MEARKTEHLEVEVVKREGDADAVVMKMRGEIDSFGQEAMNAAYAEAEASDPKVIVLDFAEVAYINSTGIALIVGVLAKARAAKRELIASGLSEHYVEIFTITRLSDFMKLTPKYEASQPVSDSAGQPVSNDEALE